MRKELEIDCPVFQKQEPIINELTNNINKAKDARERAGASGKFREEMGVLLSCLDYNEERLDCGNCRFIAKLRKMIIDLIHKPR